MNIEIIGHGTWYDKTAQKLLMRERKLKRTLTMLKTEMGIGASGFPHIGSLGDAARSYAVTLALREQGYNSKLVAFCDDKDGLRKVPAGMPKKLEKYIGFPVSSIPDPFGCHESYGKHMSSLLLESLDSCGIEYESISGKDAYEKGLLFDEIRTILYDFMQRKTNIQYHELASKNPSAFVWLDEPGLGWAFSGLTGYDDIQAGRDYRQFLGGLEGPPALHLCANVNLPYLLSLGIEILSFDAYQIEFMPRDYAGAVADFISGGGIISWGIVPVDSFSLTTETPQTLADRLSGYWRVVSDSGAVSEQQIAENALIAPARCCLKDIGMVGAPGEAGGAGKISGGEEQLVEKAFGYLGEMSRLLRERYGL